MICRACAFANDSDLVACRACGKPLRDTPAALVDQFAPLVDSYEARIAAVESQLETLTTHLSAVNAERAAIAEGLAQIRRVSRRLPPPPASLAFRTLDVGTFHVTFERPHGARVEMGNARPALERVPIANVQAATDRQLLQIRSDAEREIWQGIASGSRVIRVVGEPGAGTTTLLSVLAADARNHGFSDGALVLDEVWGPASDIGQRLAALVHAGGAPRYYLTGELLQMFAGVRALVLLDRAELTADEMVVLAELFPSFCFVVATQLTLSNSLTVTLGPLALGAAQQLIEAGYGRRVEGVELSAMIDIAATIGSLPGRLRLIGIAVGQLGGSFSKLRDEFVTGSAIVRAFIAGLSPIERRILSIVSLAPAVLTADLIGSVVASGNPRPALERLHECELVRLCGDRYILPRYLQPLVAALPDEQTVFGTIIEVCSAALESAPMSGRSLPAAEAIVRIAFERSYWLHVLALGPPLADHFALHGALGAWGRVLNLIAAAAKRIDDPTALNLARHELGVRSLLLNAPQKATSFLESAARDRGRAGDVAGAAASKNVLAIVEASLPDPGFAYKSTIGRNPIPSEPRTREPITRTRRRRISPAARASRTVQWSALFGRRAPRMLLLGLLAAVVAVLYVWNGTQPKPQPRITAFSADRMSIEAGSTARLCVAATDAALVQIAPDVGALPPEGKQCVAVHPATTTMYTAVATGHEGERASDALTVVVRAATPAQRRILTVEEFSVTPSRIKAGESVRLCYAVSGADVLRIAPSVGRLDHLRSCRNVTPADRHAFTYRLVAIGENGQIAIRRARVEVVATEAPIAQATPVARATPVATVLANPTAPPGGPVAPVRQRRKAPDGTLARKAIYQFDATPAAIERGQTASLCVGIGRWARGDVNGIGTLAPGITRCYRVRPRATTVYRLHVALDDSIAVETVTVAVRTRTRVHEVDREARR